MSKTKHSAPMRLYILGVLHGSHIAATIMAYGTTAHHAMKRMKKETEGASLCIIGEAKP